VVEPLSRRVVAYTEKPDKLKNIIKRVVEPLSRRVVTNIEKCAVVEVRLESLMVETKIEKCTVVEVRLDKMKQNTEKCAVVEVRLEFYQQEDHLLGGDSHGVAGRVCEEGRGQGQDGAEH
jgi:hypothetical protein